MESEQYIYPGELAALLAFLVLPPLILAAMAQFPFLLWRGVSGGRALASLIATALLSITITLAMFFFASGILPQGFGIREVKMGGHGYPVLPLAFAVVAVVSAVVSSWVGRQRHQ